MLYLTKIKSFLIAILLFTTVAPFSVLAQTVWAPVSDSFGALPASIQIFKTVSPQHGKAFLAYYAKIDLKNDSIKVYADTSKNRRLTPQQFFEKNNAPYLVVNSTFFSFEQNKSLNLVMADGKILEQNQQSLPQKGKDTLTYKHVLASAFGIDKKRNADVAWTYTAKNKTYSTQTTPLVFKDSSSTANLKDFKKKTSLKKWKMKYAVGGGPVLLQNGQVKISNNEEQKFSGKKGLEDLHPRTVFGYTANHEMIILMVQGRFPGIAEGATLPQCAALMQELGCVEAINMDGGGSSCMLINGENTITPSDKKGEQRPVPAVWVVTKH